MKKRNRLGEEISAERAKIKKEYGILFDAVSEILFRHDPAEMNFGFNKAEYEPEAETILPHLKNCFSEEDVLLIVNKEFRKCFTEEIADRKENTKIAEEIWWFWNRRNLV